MAKRSSLSSASCELRGFTQLIPGAFAGPAHQGIAMGAPQKMHVLGPGHGRICMTCLVPDLSLAPPCIVTYGSSVMGHGPQAIDQPLANVFQTQGSGRGNYQPPQVQTLLQASHAEIVAVARNSVVPCACRADAGSARVACCLGVSYVESRDCTVLSDVLHLRRARCYIAAPS